MFVFLFLFVYLFGSYSCLFVLSVCVCLGCVFSSGSSFCVCLVSGCECGYVCVFVYGVCVCFSVKCESSTYIAELTKGITKHLSASQGDYQHHKVAMNRIQIPGTPMQKQDWTGTVNVD